MPNRHYLPHNQYEVTMPRSLIVDTVLTDKIRKELVQTFGSDLEVTFAAGRESVIDVRDPRFPMKGTERQAAEITKRLILEHTSRCE